MLQVITQSLLLSGLYALIAVGFALIFSVGRVLNLAYGAYLMIGGYSYFWAVQILHMPKLVGVLFAIAMGALVGMLKYRWLVRRLNGNQVAVEISTLILAVVMQSMIILLFDSSPKIVQPIVDGIWRVGGATVTNNILVATVASWVILIGLMLLVKNTYLGRSIRAVSMDAKGAVLAGIEVEHVNYLTWGISGALGAVAGVFFASYTQLSPNMWVAPLIIAVAVVIVGGIGSILGTLIVAHIIGTMEIVTTTFIAPDLRGVFTMLLIILVLLVRPQGLFGRKELAQ